MSTEDAPTAARDRSSKAVGAIVSGIGALVFVFLFFPLGIVLGIVGLALGTIGYRETQRRQLSGGGLAVTGIIASAVALVIGVVAVIGFVQLAERTETDPLEDPEGFEEEVEDILEEEVS